MDKPLFRIGTFEVTVREVLLAVALAVMGFVFSMRSWLGWLNTLDPIKGLGVYYVVLLASLVLLSALGLTVFGFKIKQPLQLFGLLLITFSFFITVGFSAEYTNIVTMGSSVGVSQVFYGCEDGATFYFWDHVMGVSDLENARLLTYVVTPFVLTLIGAVFVTGRVHFL